MNVPFEGDIPAGFKGIDVQALCTRLEGLHVEKGEYETTAGFERRKQKLFKAPVLGSLSVRSPVALVFMPDVACYHRVMNQYDADKGILSVEWQDEKVNDSYFSGMWNCGRKQLGSYPAENAFGVNRMVQRYEEESYGVAVHVPNPLFSSWRTSNSYNRNVQVDIKMGVDDAKRLNHHLAFLVVGTLREPFVRVVESTLTPTLETPTRVDVKYHLLDVDVRRMLVVFVPTGEVVYEFTDSELGPSR
jgi:hypothetical protein